MIRTMFLLLLLVLSLVLLKKSFEPAGNSTSLINRLAHPFDSRVHYRLGEIDPRFNMSAEDIKQLADQAAHIWQQGAGKSLLVYDPSARLAINLIYDQRQADYNQQQQIQSSLNQELLNQQQGALQVKTLQQQLEQERTVLESRKSDFRQRLDRYNNTVAMWNSTGRIDQQTRDQLNQQKAQLDNEQKYIQYLVDQFNQHVADVNKQGQNVNLNASQYNERVSHYRSQFSPRQFEKGVFNGRSINIYEFSNADDLRLTIAHEMGHALGLKHNNDPYALMYPILQKQDIANFTLTQADLAMLQR